jgi:CDP-paratose 2-epimerase
MLEAIARFEQLIGKKLKREYVQQARRGDHICYISNLRRFKSDYPNWELTRSLDSIFKELTRQGHTG